MICKNCGKEIENNSLFCGYCGAKVEKEEVVQVAPVIQAEPVVQVAPVQQKPVVQVAPVQSEPVAQVAPVQQKPVVQVAPVQSEPVVQVAPVQSESVVQVAPVIQAEPVVQVAPVQQKPVVQVAPVQSESVVQVAPVIQAEPVVQVAPVQAPIASNGKTDKKSGGVKIVLAILIIAVTLGTIGYLLYSYFAKNNSGSVEMLTKAISNIKEQGKNSGTIDADLSIKFSTGNNFDFNLTSKYYNQDGKYKYNFKLAKSLIFDEQNIYLEYDNSNLVAYIPSTLIDLLESTQSDTLQWIKYSYPINVDELSNEINIEELKSNINFYSLKYVATTNGLKQYDLIIDQKKLKDYINSTTEEEQENYNLDLETYMDEYLSYLDYVTISLYFDDSKDLSKIKFVVTNLPIDNFESATLEINISNLGKTEVTIPTAALNSTIDLDTYKAENAVTDITQITFEN